MAVKSILDVEVDRDGNFAKFTALFDKYQRALKDSPGEWAKVTAGIGRSRKEFEQIVKHQIAVQARQKLIKQAAASEERRMRGWSDAWRDVARSSTTVARNMLSITTSMLKWSVFGTAASGLLGLGGLFGIDRLAGAVSSGRRSSLGLGLSYGAQKSFGVNFSRLVDPESFLSSVAGAKMDVTRRTGLIGAGLTPGEIDSDTGTTAVALLKNLKRLADNTDPRLYSQVIAARQLGQFVSPEDLQRLRGTSAKEFNELLRANAGGVGGLGLDPATQKAWQDFTTQMSRAAQGIENTFVKGLVRLEPGLEKLSAGFERAVAAFVGSDAVKTFIDKLAVGLETFAKYIGTDEFKTDIEVFANGVGKVASAIGRALKWFGENTRFSAEGNPDWDESQKRVAQLRKDRAEGKATAWSQFVDIFTGKSPAAIEDYIRESAKKRGLDPDVAVKVAKSEGLYRYEGDYDATGKPTSFGPFQLHYRGVGRFTNPGLGEEFTKYTGLDARDRNTTKAQIDFALDYAKQHGWGPWHGWTGSPNAGGAGTGVKVTIENNTGGNAVVTTNQVAQ